MLCGHGQGGDRVAPGLEGQSPLPCGLWAAEAGEGAGGGERCCASCSLLTEPNLAALFSFFLEKLLLFPHFRLPGIIFFDEQRKWGSGAFNNSYPVWLI